MTRILKKCMGISAPISGGSSIETNLNDFDWLRKFMRQPLISSFNFEQILSDLRPRHTINT